MGLLSERERERESRMVVFKMDVLAVGQVVGTVRVGVESACGRREAVAVCSNGKKPQGRVIVSAERLKKWPSVRVGAPSSLGSLGVRCSATSGGDDEPKKVRVRFGSCVP